MTVCRLHHVPRHRVLGLQPQTQARVRRCGQRAVCAAGRREGPDSNRNCRARRAGVMSDFTSGFWNIYVIVLVVLSIAGCAWLLWATGRVKVGAPKGRGRSRRAAQGGRDGPRLGRRPAGVQQSVAEVVVEPVLGDDRVRHRVPDPLSGPRHVPGRAGLVVLRRLQVGNVGSSTQGCSRSTTSISPWRSRRSPRTRRRGRPASDCSSRTVRRATVRTPAAARPSRVCATTIGCTVASRRTS